MKTFVRQKGAVIVQTLVFGFLAVIIITALVAAGGTALKASRLTVSNELAFNIAEAGIEYYRWHLAHDNDDYQDGTGAPGPYVHSYSDKNGDTIGEFVLDITPPQDGSTVVTIKSTGIPLNASSSARSIEVEMAIPSLANYAVVANDQMRFGSGTEVFGPIHSNGGIRFDGLAHNIVSSSKNEYEDNDSDACTVNSWGVHTCLFPADPEPPVEPPAREDVFMAGRSYPEVAVNFAGITSDLKKMKDDAKEGGHYFGDSGSVGYHIVLKTNDTFDLYKVTSNQAPPSDFCSHDQENWGIWSVGNEVYVDNYQIPDNGLIFVEDDVWVDGQIDSARVTVASGKFPAQEATYTNIIINDDLLYTNYDGQDVVALIAQGDISSGLYSEDDLQVDAALVAQNGRVGRYYYPKYKWWWIFRFDACKPYDDRDTITLNGMIATNERYGFAYTDGNGYDVRNINYDADLLYGPPPSFPLTTDEYETILWREVDN